MPISLVIGGAVVGTALGGANVTLTLPALQSGDVVYIAGGFNSFDDDPDVLTSGFTLLSSLFSVNANFGLWRKVMGIVPDAEVICLGQNGAGQSSGYAAFCLRGVDQTTSEDVATTSDFVSPGITTSPVNAPITTVTPSAWVLVFAGSVIDDPDVTAPAGYGNQVNGSSGGVVPRFTIGAATKNIALAGTETPAGWGNWANSTWSAFTVAVRPADGGLLGAASEAGLSGSVGDKGGYTIAPEFASPTKKRRPSPEPKGPSLFDLVKKQQQEQEEEDELLELITLIDTLENPL